ncbi:MAG TPA: small basic protein [Phycisphaerae bacterium]|nr:small basic protein [Phycisphaerae bacterium]
MSLDKSLKSSGALTRHRNVLSRAERIEKLADDEKWDDGDAVFGLPKVAHRKVQTRKPTVDASAVAEGAQPSPAAEGEPAEAPPADRASKAGDPRK